jgi:hypothetical protein
LDWVFGGLMVVKVSVVSVVASVGREILSVFVFQLG